MSHRINGWPTAEVLDTLPAGAVVLFPWREGWRAVGQGSGARAEASGLPMALVALVALQANEGEEGVWSDGDPSPVAPPSTFSPPPEKNEA